jgi:predicted ABC-class ATPase
MTLTTHHELRNALQRLEGQSYAAYKRIAGRYTFDAFTLHIDHVQGDPFAEPSRLRTMVLPAVAALPPELLTTAARRTAAADFLNRAIERGVYDHIPGDGRERVVALDSAVKVRAEDGRRIAGTDISGFIGNLPGGADTRHFQTDNASGSTSQAAAIVEALEMGTRCLLLDEDTSATNFLIRDARVQALVARQHEPITPFIDRVRELWERDGVSLVLVVGGSGDYFDVADTVIAMRDYLPLDVTGEAREVAARLPTGRRPEAAPWSPIRQRVPLPESIEPRRGKRAVDVRAVEPGRVRFGEAEIDLGAVEQLVEAAQTRAIARALTWGRGRCIDGHRPLRDALQGIVDTLHREGLDVVDDRRTGDYAEFRRFELAATLNRLRPLRVVPWT